MADRREVFTEARAGFDAIALAITILSSKRELFEALLENERYMDNVGCLIHPTLFKTMQASDNFHDNISACKAAVTFLNTMAANPRWNLILNQTEAALPDVGAGEA